MICHSRDLEIETIKQTLITIPLLFYFYQHFKVFYLDNLCRYLDNLYDIYILYKYICCFAKLVEILSTFLLK